MRKRQKKKKGALRWIVLCGVFFVLLIGFAREGAELLTYLTVGVDFPQNDSRGYAACFHDFYCDDEFTYYRCDINIENHTKEEKTVWIRGILPLDYLSGFINSPFLHADDGKGGEMPVVVPPESCIHVEDFILKAPRNVYDVQMKWDRKLPVLYAAAA